MYIIIHAQCNKCNHSQSENSSTHGGSGGGGQVTGAAVVAHGGGVGGQVCGCCVVDTALHSQLPLLSESPRLPDAAASSNLDAATMSTRKAAL
jgi:hypothetical protein